MGQLFNYIPGVFWVTGIAEAIAHDVDLLLKLFVEVHFFFIYADSVVFPREICYQCGKGRSYIM